MTCVGTSLYGIMNAELESRKEFERRKKLRLLQVRQQSKEFADKLRGRIKGEIIQQKRKYVEAENKLNEEKHLQELCRLKEFYDRCLQSIGKGHKEAAKQPDLNLEKQAMLARISEKAAKRGVKAMKKHFGDEASLKQIIEAPVTQKKAIRNKENLRAFFISSLPKPAENSGPVTVPHKSSHQTTEPQKTRRVLEEIPTNLKGHEIQVSGFQNHKSTEKQNTPREHPKVVGQEYPRYHQPPEPAENNPGDSVSNVSSPKECSCDYVVCSCHKSPGELRRCLSESRISSEKCLDLDEFRKKKARSRSCSPRSVRTLNYFGSGNVYESNQQSCVRVTHHSRSPKRAEDESVSNTVQEVPVSKPSAEELKKRTDERGAKALKKEQLKRDFQHLIQNLKKLTQEKTEINSKTKGKLKVLSSEREIATRNETKQKKLNDAFEKLPHRLKSNKARNPGVKEPNQKSADDSSPPTLNLASCQTNMPSPTIRKVVSTEEITISETPTSGGGSRRSKSVDPRSRYLYQQNKPKTTRSSSKAQSGAPNVLVKRDPSGDVHITVKVSEVYGGTSRSPSSPGSSSSYMSPPTNLTPSQQQLLDALLCQVNKRSIGDELRKYITKLLNMSRESIDDLRGPGTPGSSPSVSPDIERDLMKLGELAEVYAEKVNTLVNMYEQMSPDSPSSPLDPIRAPPQSASPYPGPSPTQRFPRSSPSPRQRPLVTPPMPAARGGMRRTTPSPTSSGSRSSVDMDELIFGGIPGVAIPDRAETAAMMAARTQGSPLSPLPEGYDLDADIRQRMQRIREIGEEESSRPACSPGTGGCADVSGSAFGGREENDFGDEDLCAGIETVFQEEARLENSIDNPEDFPSLSNVFGPDFSWANFNQQNFISSFPGATLERHCVTDGDEVIKLDSSFNTSAFRFPLNPERLNALREKFANTCKDQYREIIGDVQKDSKMDKFELEDIQKDSIMDKLELGDALKQATSDRRCLSPPSSISSLCFF